MKNKIKETLHLIGELLHKEDYTFEVKETEDDRLTLSINESMKDTGLSSGNSVIDLFYEEVTKIVFVGMFRIPRKVRGKKLSTQIIDQLKTLAEQNEYTLMVDACDECDRFWKKQGFTFVYRDSLGFDILAYSKENTGLSSIWQEFKKTKVFKKNLFIHN